MFHFHSPYIIGSPPSDAKYLQSLIVFIPTAKLIKYLLKSAFVKKEILDKILLISNNERREILIKRYLENKPVVTISKEMFMTYQGIYYHLDIGEKEIEKLF